ncbi:MAG: NAD(P)/FAD-dependent oxidoreductase, partial [Candidatus Hodarchaeales archaeon]
MGFIIIGNGPAGVTAARTIATAAPKGFPVLLFSDEDYPHYAKPKLPSYVGDATITADNVVLYDEHWYKRQKIELHLNEKVERVNPEERQITTKYGAYSFSRLLLATGASCYVPPMQGGRQENFFTIRTLSDAIAIRKQLIESDSVVVIGGGILGLEIAHACRKKSVHVVEYFPYLLPKQLDQEGASILQGILEKQGLQFHLGTTVETILGDNKVKGVRLADDREIPAEMALICAGIIPKKTLAEQAGIACNRGILVDDYLETSIEGIYAAGDVAEHNNTIYGLWNISQEQARVAAANMLKPRSQKYSGSKIGTTLKVANLYLTSLGNISPQETA